MVAGGQWGMTESSQ